MKIFFQVGILYVMEVISWFVGGPEAIWYITDAMNSLRGLLIFVIFCCKPKVWKGIQRKFPCLMKHKKKKKLNTREKTAGVKLNEYPDETGSREAVETPLEENNEIDFSRNPTK